MDLKIVFVGHCAPDRGEHGFGVDVVAQWRRRLTFRSP